MFNRSDFKRGMGIGARLTGVAESRTTVNLVGVSNTIVSRVMTAYTNLASSEKHNSGGKSKLKDHDRRMLKRIVAKNARLHYCR
ncbi:hypothetical protein TNCV_1785571 [Trichonephila clavipes]|nr:hypothetical protein TNCV_1785571 [Trichonephila clavipes]